MGVARITCDEPARQAIPCLLRRDVVEAVRDALAYLVDCEPNYVLHVERKRPEHALGSLDHLFLRDVSDRVAIGRVDLTEVDVEPHQVTALTRDKQDVALVRRLYRRL